MFERRDVGDGDVVLAAAQLVGRDGEHVGELVARRAAAVHRGELLARLVDVALPAAQRARRPVLAAQLVEHGAVDARPRELLERRALVGVVAVDRGDQGLEPARDEVVDLAARRQLAHLLEDDVLDQRGVGHDQAVAGLDVAGRLVPAPEGERVLVRDPLPAHRRGGHRVKLLLKVAAASGVTQAGIGLGAGPQHHRFGVIALKPRRAAPIMHACRSLGPRRVTRTVSRPRRRVRSRSARSRSSTEST